MGKVKKEVKQRVMDFVNKENSREYELRWDEKGDYKHIKKTDIKKGRKLKGSGSRFELKVRKDLESKGKIVDKWNNNVDLDKGELIIAKRKFNPFSKALTIGTGFPDFISIKHIHEGLYSVIGVEAKMNGMLSKIEKEKCAWYLQKKIFSEIWIAKQGEKRGEIKYDDFIERYGKKYNKT